MPLHVYVHAAAPQEATWTYAWPFAAGTVALQFTPFPGKAAQMFPTQAEPFQLNPPLHVNVHAVAPQLPTFVYAVPSTAGGVALQDVAFPGKPAQVFATHAPPFQ